MLPPWLNVNPGDFLRATEAGAAMGHAISEASLRAWEEQERMKMAQQQHSAQMAQAAQQFSQNLALEQQRLKATQDLKNAQQNALTQYRLNQIGLGESRLQHAQDTLDERAQRHDQMAKAQQDALDQRTKYENSLLDLRKQLALGRASDPSLTVFQAHAKDVQKKLLEPGLSDDDKNSLTSELANTMAAINQAGARRGSKLVYNSKTGKIEPSSGAITGGLLSQAGQQGAAALTGEPDEQGE